MKTRNATPRFPGQSGGLSIDGRPVPYLSGVLPRT